MLRRDFLHLTGPFVSVGPDKLSLSAGSLLASPVVVNVSRDIPVGTVGLVIGTVAFGTICLCYW